MAEYPLIPDDNKPSAVTLNADDPFEAALIAMVETNRRKRADYASDGDPWRNFKDTARQVNSTPGMSCEVLIATKQSRLSNLLGTGRNPQNESVEDTVLDRAVYSVIALAMFKQGLYADLNTDLPTGPDYPQKAWFCGCGSCTDKLKTNSPKCYWI